MAKRLKCWKRESRGTAVIFRNKKTSSKTYEIHEFDAEGKEAFGANYYHFPALKGRGIPSSPEFAQTKTEAIKEARKYMKDHDSC